MKVWLRRRKSTILHTFSMLVYNSVFSSSNSWFSWKLLHRLVVKLFQNIFFIWFLLIGVTLLLVQDPKIWTMNEETSLSTTFLWFIATTKDFEETFFFKLFVIGDASYLCGLIRQALAWRVEGLNLANSVFVLRKLWIILDVWLNSDYANTRQLWLEIILYLINTMLCPITRKSNTIELIVHTSCYCVLYLLCVTTACGNIKKYFNAF